MTHRTRKRDYLAGVERTKEYIAAGDVFQAVLSQRFDLEPGVDTFQVYRALRTVNPSPYMYFLAFRGGGPAGCEIEAEEEIEKSKGAAPFELAGSSPELLVRVHGRKVEYRPIAGTRPRGADEKADQELADEMLHDEKERAEHVMLVDLGRNDVGRVSEYGSVKVDRLMFIERYSHVMHLVSTIEGKLKAELTAVDALRACFPAGTFPARPRCEPWKSSKSWSHRGAEPTAARSLCRFLWQSRLLHRDSLAAGEGRKRLYPGGRRNRCRLCSGTRTPGIDEQGTGGHSGGRTRARAVGTAFFGRFTSDR